MAYADPEKGLTAGAHVRLPADAPWGHPHGEVELIEGNMIGVRVRYAGRSKRAWFTVAQLIAANLAWCDWKAQKAVERLGHSVRRAMTDEERALARRMHETVSFPVASSHKRFARNMAAAALEEGPTITEKQAAFLRMIAHRYRRQLGAT